jgi:hypothetical protein
MMKKLALLLLLFATPAFGAVHSIQVTIGASATPIISSGSIPVNWVIFQDNATHARSIGDSTVTSTKGVAMSANGLFFTPRAPPNGFTTNLSGWYVSGTTRDVLDVTYDDGM